MMKPCAISFDGAAGEGAWMMVQMRKAALKGYKDKVLCRSPKYLIVKESKGKGRGVFTTIDLQKDDLVTVFPMHYVRCLDNGGWGEWLTEPLDMQAMKKYSLDYPGEGLRFSGHPTKYEEEGLGHLINDGARISSPLPGRKKVYERVSREKQNVQPAFFTTSCDLSRTAIPSNTACFMVATKLIKAGEELFFSYGPGYWEDELEDEPEDACLNVGPATSYLNTMD